MRPNNLKNAAELRSNIEEELRPKITSKIRQNYAKIIDFESLCTLHVKVSKRAAKWVYTRESNHGLKTGAVLRLVSHGWPVSIGHNPAWSLVVTFMILKIFWNRIVNKCTYFLSTISGSMWHWVKASLMVSISSSAYTLGQ